MELRHFAAVLLSAALSASCATYKPPDSPDFAFRGRAEAQSQGRVRVSAVVLSADEAKRVFNADLVGSEIQPIWIEVENRDDDSYALMLLSMDPDYFSPSEAAWKTASTGERGRDAKMEYFLDQHAPVEFRPGTTSSGFVYTNFDPGAKAFAVQLLGQKSNLSFDFVLGVPGFGADFDHVDLEDHYAASEVRDLDLQELRAYIESLPCCVLGGDRSTPGDPMNLVVVGDGDHLLATFVRRGWDLTETIGAGSSFRTAMSSVFGSRYRTSPVSPLYVFDRPQDFSLQKARRTVDERNHLRLWLAPVTHRGAPVWVGQVSRDIGVKLSRRTIVTHKVDPVVDEARLYVLMDLAASQYLAQSGFAKGVGPAVPSEPRFNYTDDPYFTDGLRLVAFLNEEALAFDEIVWLEWERVPLEVE